MLERYPTPKITEQTRVREILQQTALLGLERQGFFEKAAFYGGTALRILYGLDRFSEDLDFTLLKPNPQFDFTPFLEGLQRELTSFNFHMEMSQKTKNQETGIVSAFLKANTIQFLITIGEDTKAINHNEKIKIKLEVDTDPPLHFRVENRLVLNPTSFYALTLHQSDLFGGKMHAVLCRNWKGRIKGRDWYDLIWYIKNNIPLSIDYLEQRMRQTGHFIEKRELTSDDVIDRLHDKIQKIDWKNATEDVRPFLADPGVLDIWSSSFFEDLIQKLSFE